MFVWWDGIVAAVVVIMASMLYVCLFVVKHECRLLYLFCKFVCVMACVSVLVGCMWIGFVI